MDSYLIAVGLWNFIGAFFMLTFLNGKIAQLILVDWTKIFKKNYENSFFAKIWLVWAAGLNIFFGAINILCTKWAMPDLKIFIIYFDLVAYILFIIMGIWGVKTKNCGVGIYVAMAIFLFWIIWGCVALN